MDDVIENSQTQTNQDGKDPHNGLYTRVQGKWVEKNSELGLIQLILHDRYRAKSESTERWLPTEIWTKEIASFLRFEKPVPVLYVLGGRQGDPQTSPNKLDAVEVFDTWSNSWNQVPQMSMNRVGSAACPLGEFGVFVAGGYSDGPGEPLSSTEIYDPHVPGSKHGVWTKRASMTQPRYGLVLLKAQNDDIYAIGGSSGSDVCSIVERYKPSEDAWTMVAPLPEPLAGGRGVEINGLFFYVGGFIPNGRLSNRIHIYHPEQDRWVTSKALLKVPRTTFAMGYDAVRGNIMVAGGQQPPIPQNQNMNEYYTDNFIVSSHVEEISLGKILNEVERPRSDPIEAISHLPSHRTGCLGTFLPGIGMIVLGGEIQGAAPAHDKDMCENWNEAIVYKDGLWSHGLEQPRDCRVAYGLVQTNGYPMVLTPEEKEEDAIAYRTVMSDIMDWEDMHHNEPYIANYEHHNMYPDQYQPIHVNFE